MQTKAFKGAPGGSDWQRPGPPPAAQAARRRQQGEAAPRPGTACEPAGVRGVVRGGRKGADRVAGLRPGEFWGRGAARRRLGGPPAALEEGGRARGARAGVWALGLMACPAPSPVPAGQGREAAAVMPLHLAATRQRASRPAASRASLLTSARAGDSESCWRCLQLQRHAVRGHREAGTRRKARRVGKWGWRRWQRGGEVEQ